MEDQMEGRADVPARTGFDDGVLAELDKRPEPEAIGADGLPIKIGDTVYLESFGRPFTVVGFDGAYLKDADGGYLRADCATHTLPDTQEQIDEDASKNACEYFGYEGKECDFGCPAFRPDAKFEGCRNFAVADLLRRQRELDAKTMGGGR